MADRVWKCVYPQVFGHFKQLSLNKFFDPSTPSMRKVDDGEKKRKKKKRKEKKKEKNVVFIGHYTSLPAVDRPNVDLWNAARSCQFEGTRDEVWTKKVYSIKKSPPIYKAKHHDMNS